MPHFMASYRLLYRTREQVVEHRWASTYVPLILLSAVVYALLTPSHDPQAPGFANATIVELLAIMGALLLAWHYTGQAWGMTASFAYIAGARMDDVERRLIRSGYLALLVWHVVWLCLTTLDDPDLFIGSLFHDHKSSVAVVYHVWSVVVLLTIPLGVAGFLRIRRRTGTAPPLRSYSPWVAIYLWYALIWAYPGLFICLQMFHALQYLIFPLRVEMNQYAAQQHSERRRVFHAIGYYVILVVIGLVVDGGPPLAYFLGDKRLDLYALVLGFVNIHHYVIDGAIWKIRNPKVRRDLFAHLAPS
jgi:hypothetical protein